MSLALSPALLHAVDLSRECDPTVGNTSYAALPFVSAPLFASRENPRYRRSHLQLDNFRRDSLFHDPPFKLSLCQKMLAARPVPPPTIFFP